MAHKKSTIRCHDGEFIKNKNRNLVTDKIAQAFQVKN